MNDHLLNFDEDHLWIMHRTRKANVPDFQYLTSSRLFMSLALCLEFMLKL